MPRRRSFWKTHKNQLLGIALLFAAGLILFMLSRVPRRGTDARYGASADLSAAFNYLKYLEKKASALRFGLNPSATSPQVKVFDKDLGTGSYDPDVRELQQFLNAEGYVITQSGDGSPGHESAYFGPATRKALVRFQADHHISPANGYFGASTRDFMNPDDVDANITASSSNNIFSYPHGTAQVGNKIILGTVRGREGRLILFPDPSNLNKYIATTTPGYINLAAAAYDAGRNRVYFAGMRSDSHHLVILSVDPETLAWTPVFEFGLVENTGYSTIQTDGAYVYVATQSRPAYMLKISISDWSLVKSNAFPELDGFHSSALYSYPGREEWYISTFSIPTAFFKVDTLNLYYVSSTISESGDATNDLYFRPLNDKGGLVYQTSEDLSGIDVINTADMTAKHYTGPASYGLFSDGSNLISLTVRNSQIILYKNFDLHSPYLIELPEYITPNQWFKTPDGRTFFTSFTAPSALYEYRLPE